MVNYQLGKIYKLTNNINEKIYIGSTTIPYLCSRLQGHKCISKLEITSRRQSILYNAMRDIGHQNFKIELIENYSCENQKELREREQYWIDQLKPEYNQFRAILNPDYEKMRNIRDKDKRQQLQHKYYHTHKEEILKKYSVKYECECGSIIRKGDIARHKKSTTHLKFIDPNYQPIKKDSVKYECECGSFYCKKNMYRHKKSIKHLNFINSVIK
jgi:group I intron endonuclease